MPHFFHQENNLPSSANEFDPDPLLRTRTEIAAMVHYLRTFSKPLDMVPIPEGMVGDAQRGEELFVSVGCLACHANLDARDPLDSAGRTFGEKWITDELAHQGLSEADAKQRYEAMSRNDRVRFAMRRFTPDRREAARAAAEAEEVAATREDRDPDPKKLYVPPVFTREAPELSGIGTKLVDNPSDPEQVRRGRLWMYNWLRDPRHYSSYTRMPRLFRENYYWESDPADQRRKTDQDILDVAAYLLTLRNDDFDRTPTPDDQAHREQVERLILALLGGQNTEAVSRKILNDEKLAPSDPFGRLTAAIVSQVHRSFGEGEAGRRAVAEIIDKSSGSLIERQKLFLGLKMISHYGCYSCHTIPGFEDAARPGTDLTLWAEKFMSQLDFAFFSPIYEKEWARRRDVFGHIYPVSAEFEHLVRDAGGNPEQEVLHNHASFAYHKFMNPRIWDREKIKKPYEKLKMPNFFLSEEEARSLVTWMLSMRQSNVRPAVQIDYERTPAGKIARGRALVRELNCVGCHTIEGNEANIHQYYSRDPALPDTDPRSSRFMPPLLWGEGAKVQPNWLFSFLNNVEMLRPWMKARMPSFHLTRQEATALVEYFAGVAQDEAGTLRDELSPILRHFAQVHAGGESAGPGAWFLEGGLSEQARFLARYGVAKNQIRATDLAARGTTPAELAEEVGPAYEKVVDRAKFLEDVFDVEYPFSDPASHLAEAARYDVGKDFFLELKCLACHVAGDPKAPGTTTDIKAPNFALTFKRLQYDWVMNWLRDPQALMPGTNMPQIFPGTSYFAPFPPEERARKEEKYGRSMQEQGALLVDFLYSMGERRETVVQPADPAAAAPPPPPAPAGDAEFDFDGGGEAQPATSQPASQPTGGEFDF